MLCSFCAKLGQSVELLNIMELTKHPSHGFDFDKDGKPFYVCPQCFTADNRNLYDEREMIRNIIQNESLISNRQIKHCIQQLAFRNGFESEEARKKAIAEINNKSRLLSDDSKIQFIAEAFDIPKLRVETMIIVGSRKHYNRINKPKERFQERNWRVIHAR